MSTNEMNSNEKYAAAQAVLVDQVFVPAFVQLFNEKCAQANLSDHQIRTEQDVMTAIGLADYIMKKEAEVLANTVSPLTKAANAINTLEGRRPQQAQTYANNFAKIAASIPEVKNAVATITGLDKRADAGGSMGGYDGVGAGLIEHLKGLMHSGTDAVENLHPNTQNALIGGAGGAVLGAGAGALGAKKHRGLGALAGAVGGGALGAGAGYEANDVKGLIKRLLEHKTPGVTGDTGPTAFTGDEGAAGTPNGDEVSPAADRLAKAPGPDAS